MNFVDIWSRDPDKRQYRKLDFLPNQGHTDDTYNTWRGFEVCKLAGVEPCTDISPFHRLVEALTDGETDYFVKWLADRDEDRRRQDRLRCNFYVALVCALCGWGCALAVVLTR